MLLQMAFHYFWWPTNIPLYIHTTFSFCLPVNGHLGCFHILVIANSATMNTGVCVFFQIRVFIFSGYMPWSGMVGSYGNFIFVFFFRNFHTFFHITWVYIPNNSMLLLLLLGRFSRVRLCATPETAAHQAPLSPGFSRQEHRSGLPSPSPRHESEKWKWNHSVVSDS